MRFWSLFFKTLGYLWVSLACLVILAGTIGVWIKEGFSAVQDLLSPFNIWNFILMAVLLAPGLGFLTLSSKIKRKMER